MIKKYFVITACITAFTAVVHAKSFDLTIFHTNNTNGVLKGCSCPRGGDGGLDRRMTVLRDQRSSVSNSLLLDSGDLFPVMPDSFKSKVVLDIMQDMQYDFVGIGDQEFTNGLSFIKYHVDKALLPFCAVNVQYIDTDSQVYPLTQPYRIIEKQGRSIGLIGVTSPDAFKFFPTKQKKNIVIAQVDEMLKPVLHHMEQEGVDIIVLVSHSGYNLDQALAQRFPQLDVIVGGHSQTLLAQPKKMGSTLIVQAGSDGANLGRLDLTFDDTGKITNYTGKLLPLNRDITGDSAVINKIKAFNKSRSKNRFWR